MSGQAYSEFLAAKQPRPLAAGLDAAPPLNALLFPHQRDCVEFGLRMGRFGLFLDTDLGKTLCQLEWSKHAAAASNGYALILAPLAVAGQIAREGRAFDYDCRVIRDQPEAKPGINICNYDRLDRLTPDAFGAVALDESSMVMWSNRGDVVLSPFMGIGSEGDCAIRMGRKFFGVELKESYWRQAVRNLDAADRSSGDIFQWAPNAA